MSEISHVAIIMNGNGRWGLKNLIQGISDAEKV